MTVSEIEMDGIPVAARIPLGNDSVTGRMGRALAEFGRLFQESAPELLFLLGDRYEIFAVAGAATACRIPIAHLHGGERTDGAMDEAFRHAITKMSYLHFTSTEAYRQRVIQLGEAPGRVFNTGAIGLANLSLLELPSKEELEKELGFHFDEKTLIVTFHPVTLEDPGESERQFSALLRALEKSGARFLITGANADCGGDRINRMISEYVSAHPELCKAFDSLGTRRYFAAVKYSAGVVGNSSSGILEVPLFHRGTVNIGDRQKGRIAPASVIHCDSDELAIGGALKKLFSPAFRASLGSVISPYGNGRGVVEKILCETRLALEAGIDLKKAFYDINMAFGN